MAALYLLISLYLSGAVHGFQKLVSIKCEMENEVKHFIGVAKYEHLEKGFHMLTIKESDIVEPNIEGKCKYISKCITNPNNWEILLFFVNNIGISNSVSVQGSLKAKFTPTSGNNSVSISYDSMEILPTSDRLPPKMEIASAKLDKKFIHDVSVKCILHGQAWDKCEQVQTTIETYYSGDLQSFGNETAVLNLDIANSLPLMDLRNALVLLKKAQDKNWSCVSIITFFQSKHSVVEVHVRPTEIHLILQLSPKKQTSNSLTIVLIPAITLDNKNKVTFTTNEQPKKYVDVGVAPTTWDECLKPDSNWEQKSVTVAVVLLKDQEVLKRQKIKILSFESSKAANQETTFTMAFESL